MPEYHHLCKCAAVAAVLALICTVLGAHQFYSYGSFCDPSEESYGLHGCTGEFGDAYKVFSTLPRVREACVVGESTVHHVHSDFRFRAFEQGRRVSTPIRVRLPPQPAAADAGSAGATEGAAATKDSAQAAAQKAAAATKGAAQAAAQKEAAATKDAAQAAAPKDADATKGAAQAAAPKEAAATKGAAQAAAKKDAAAAAKRDAAAAAEAAAAKQASMQGAVEPERQAATHVDADGVRRQCMERQDCFCAVAYASCSDPTFASRVRDRRPRQY